MSAALERIPTADDFAGIPPEPLDFSFATDGACSAKPSLLRRIAGALGFTQHFGPEPEGIETLPGWARSDVRVGLSIGDRLRLLVSGRLYLTVTHYIDRPVDRMEVRTDLRIPPPWERRA